VLAVTLFLALGAAVVEADETVVLVCTPDIVGPQGNPFPGGTSTRPAGDADREGGRYTPSP
jgi:hypothetical protein